MSLNLSIGGTSISNKNRPFLIAELSGNHNGSLERCFELILHAKNAGADAVKLQTYTADTITIKSERPEFWITDGPWRGQSLHELYSVAHTPFEWHEDIFKFCRKNSIQIFSSPFDNTAVDLLASLDVAAYKIASPEIVDLPLIKYAAQKQKPMIVSTGMASLEEIGDAVSVIRSVGNDQIVLLHCTSAYPTPSDYSHLSNISVLKREFNVLTGLSDHSMGVKVPQIATAMGACVIEKHITISRKDGGVDAQFSLEPHEFRQLREATEEVFTIMGTAQFGPKSFEASSYKHRRSLYVVENVLPGDILTEYNVRSIRPANGMPPKELEHILGKRFTKKISSGTPLSEEMFDE